MNIPPMQRVEDGLPQSPLERRLEEQSKSIDALAESITRLANSNAMIAQALAEQIEGDEEGRPPAYLDGSPAQ